MKKDILLPQGTFKIGRDIPGGIYLIAAINDLSFVTILGANNKYEHYTLNEDKTFMCHVELEKGDTMTIDGRVKMRHVSKTFSENEVSSFNLLEEIEDFRKSINPNVAVKNERPAPNVNTRSSLNISRKKHKGGFWSTLSTLSSSSEQSDAWSSSKKKHSGKCDGDCDNCPPHYGYRHGRWYYGHNHIEGCVFGGNKGSGGRD